MDIIKLFAQAIGLGMVVFAGIFCLLAVTSKEPVSEKEVKFAFQLSLFIGIIAFLAVLSN